MASLIMTAPARSFAAMALPFAVSRVQTLAERAKGERLARLTASPASATRRWIARIGPESFHSAK